MAPTWLEELSRGIVPFGIPTFGPLEFLVLPIPLLLLRWRGKSAGYLLCFSIFFVYAWAVLALTIFYLLPSGPEMLAQIQANRWANSIHWVPSLFTGELDPRSEQVYGNFVMGMPFGFGFPFVAAPKYSAPRRAAAAGFALGLGLELGQLLIGLIVYRAPYRTIDIDDVWLVFAGALVGYGVLWILARVYRRLGWTRGATLPVWDHFHAVLWRVAYPSGEPSGSEASERPPASAGRPPR